MNDVGHSSFTILLLFTDECHIKRATNVVPTVEVSSHTFTHSQSLEAYPMRQFAYSEETRQDSTCLYG
jgi:hypothetical protein